MASRTFRPEFIDLASLRLSLEVAGVYGQESTEVVELVEVVFAEDVELEEVIVEWLDCE